MASFIYYIQAWVLGPIKIGCTSMPSLRLTNLQGAHPTELTLLALELGNTLKEAKRHAQFAHLRIQGEWFRPGEDLMAHVAAITEKRALKIWTDKERLKLAARLYELAAKLEAEVRDNQAKAQKKTKAQRSKKRKVALKKLPRKVVLNK